MVQVLAEAIERAGKGQVRAGCHWATQVQEVTGIGLGWFALRLGLGFGGRLRGSRLATNHYNYAVKPHKVLQRRVTVSSNVLFKVPEQEFASL